MWVTGVQTCALPISRKAALDGEVTEYEAIYETAVEEVRKMTRAAQIRAEGEGEELAVAAAFLPRMRPVL